MLDVIESYSTKREVYMSGALVVLACVTIVAMHAFASDRDTTPTRAADVRAATQQWFGELMRRLNGTFPFSSPIGRHTTCVLVCRARAGISLLREFDTPEEYGVFHRDVAAKTSEATINALRALYAALDERPDEACFGETSPLSFRLNDQIAVYDEMTYLMGGGIWTAETFHHLGFTMKDARERLLASLKKDIPRLVRLMHGARGAKAEEARWRLVDMIAMFGDELGLEKSIMEELVSLAPPAT